MKHLVAIACLAACGGAPQKPITNPSGPAAPAAITTADQVIEAALVAEGGRDKLAKLTSLHMTGTVEIPAAGLKGGFETFAAPPNDSVSRLDLGGLGKVLEGVHGDVAWESSALSGARVLSGPERSTAMREATFNGDLTWKQLYPKVELKGVAKFDGQDCYQVELTATDGQQQTRYYAKDTMLPIGVEMVADTQMGKLPVKVISREWRETQGFKYPYKIEHQEGPQSVILTIQKIDINAAIPPGTFDLSDDVKQLAATKTK